MNITNDTHISGNDNEYNYIFFSIRYILTACIKLGLSLLFSCN